MQTFHIQRLLLAALGLFMLTRTSDTAAQTLPPLQGIVDLAGSFESTCALTTTGGVKCWGSNSAGQLGDGTQVDRSMPVNVAGLASGVISLSSNEGGVFTCALTMGGGVQCWGGNFNGQLGDGTYTSSATPVVVTGLGSSVTAISTGDGHTCALTAGGGVQCWGLNGSGQLGDGTTMTRATPAYVAGLSSGVIAIGGGGNHSCAVMASGALKCWGDNSYGQLGDGTTTARLSPVDVIGLSTGVAAMDGGSRHSCVVTVSGGAKCWGFNLYAQVGDASSTDRLVPVDVIGMASGVSSIRAASYHSCARMVDHSVKCWGLNQYGLMGTGEIGSSEFVPRALEPLAGSVSLGTGWAHLCAVTSTGRVKCAGDNSKSQLGDDNRSRRLTPVHAFGLTNGVAMVSSGRFFTCAVTGLGGPKCWGDNPYGQIGDSTTTRRMAAVDVMGLASGVLAVTAGAFHACALTGDGGVKCWGEGSQGQLGDGTTSTWLTPVDVSGLFSGVAAITAGDSHTCALTTLGGVKCWGGNWAGQIGDGTTTSRWTPVDVAGLTSGVLAINAGESHTCALTSSQGVKCWGTNYFGQLGNGTTAGSTTPVNVIGLTSGVISVRAGIWHTCALTSGGGAKCWGNNSYGSLGDGSNTGSPIPVDVAGLTSGVVALGAGVFHTCAAMAIGGAKCWGLGGSGQLGDGTLSNRKTPVEVAGLTGGVTMLSGGLDHTCAVTTAGGLQCWGDNMAGQLGIGGRDFTLFADVLAGNSIFANGFD